MRDKILTILLFTFILIVVGLAGLETWAVIRYWNTPTSEIPGWVLWLLFWK